MKLVSFGDELIAGDKAPKILADMLGFEFVDRAKKETSNQTIFRDVIDYTYDIQKDPKIQMDMYLQQVQKIILIDINKIKNLKDRLESNRSLICKLVKRSQITLESINLNTIYISKNRQKYLGY